MPANSVSQVVAERNVPSQAVADRNVPSQAPAERNVPSQAMAERTNFSPNTRLDSIKEKLERYKRERQELD